jgi:hypothetical protein
MIGSSRRGKTTLAAAMMELMVSAEYADWRAEARRQAEDAATAAEGRPADAIPGEVLQRGPWCDICPSDAPPGEYWATGASRWRRCAELGRCARGPERPPERPRRALGR